MAEVPLGSLCLIHGYQSCTGVGNSDHCIPDSNYHLGSCSTPADFLSVHNWLAWPLFRHIPGCAARPSGGTDSSILKG